MPQQPLQLLLVLLERPGEVFTREELQQRLWSSDVFVDFDHGLNKSIQKLRDALGDSAASPRSIETLPRVGYRFIAPVNIPVSPEMEAIPERDAVDLPEAMTADVAEPSVIMDPPAPSVGRRSLVRWGLLAACVVAAAMTGIWVNSVAVRGRSAAAPIHSLAVLPLENFSGDPNQEYFADGMTDERTTMLAKNSSLRVVSRTSAMQYKGGACQFFL